MRAAMLREDSTRVIVADDDDAMRLLVATTLASEGYEVVEAASGQELVRMLESAVRDRWPIDGVDLVVLDLRMPGMSGLDTFRALRASHWDMPVILMTAFADPEVQAEATRLGIPVLSKPFPLETLTDLALVLVSRSRTDP